MKNKGLKQGNVIMTFGMRSLSKKLVKKYCYLLITAFWSIKTHFECLKTNTVYCVTQLMVLTFF